METAERNGNIGLLSGNGTALLRLRPIIMWSSTLLWEPATEMWWAYSTVNHNRCAIYGRFYSAANTGVKI